MHVKIPLLRLKAAYTRVIMANNGQSIVSLLLARRCERPAIGPARIIYSPVGKVACSSLWQEDPIYIQLQILHTALPLTTLLIVHLSVTYGFLKEGIIISGKKGYVGN